MTGGRTVLLAATALILLTAGAAGKTEEVFRVRDRKMVVFSQMVQDLKTADIIYIGELHQIESHRRLAVDIIRALHEADIPLAIGIEMFRAEDQATLTAWTAGTIEPDRFIRAYYANWRLPWSLYDDLFLYAREHRIPLVGLNIPDEVTSAVARNGFASLTEKQRKMLPPAISCTIDPKYRAFIRQAYTGHRNHSARQFEHFCEAQLVWDKSMARHLIQYRRENPGVKTIVLAGLGHAWRSGIPEQVSQEHQAVSRVVLPIVSGQITPSMVTNNDADYLLNW